MQDKEQKKGVKAPFIEKTVDGVLYRMGLDKSHRLVWLNSDGTKTIELNSDEQAQACSVSLSLFEPTPPPPPPPKKVKRAKEWWAEMERDDMWGNTPAQDHRLFWHR